jgi:hypothetical protein
VTGPEAQSLRFTLFQCQVRGYFAELFEGGFEVVDDLWGDNIGIVEFFPPFGAEPEDVEAGFVAVDELIHLFKPNPDANRRCEPMILSLDLTTRS